MASQQGKLACISIHWKAVNVAGFGCCVSNQPAEPMHLAICDATCIDFFIASPTSERGREVSRVISAPPCMEPSPACRCQTQHMHHCIEDRRVGVWGWHAADPHIASSSKQCRAFLDQHGVFTLDRSCRLQRGMDLKEASPRGCAGNATGDKHQTAGKRQDRGWNPPDGVKDHAGCASKEAVRDVADRCRNAQS